ncbi:fasciclin domain-containing protein [Sphingobacterium sp. DN00404]|uniref:Fasciclin domain-containing protein n=1 Tax=Sphingobacterium micropteri TaxID=2763501 RepID=A0ABR7YTK7_9SPHI|nr:fasciclin domain-containing protein [Sphingobacterium micropteri]MBD1434665.1 fasciclin domain-containing protein [Sphingobacterium micropteri]
MMKIMKKHHILTPLIGLIYILLLQVGCSDPWDEHARDNEGLTNEPLLERLDEESEASEFMKLLRTSGVDKVLDGNNAYTVFVPDNNSVQTVASSLQNDAEALERFVKNHIAVSTHRLNASADTVRLTMLSGKTLDFVNSEIDGAAFSKSNQAGVDGMYHVITDALIPRQSLWEYMSDHGDELQNAFILGLNEYNLYDTAVVEDPADYYLNNEFLRNVGDMRDENQRFTYFVLKDADFTAEVAQFLPYVNYRNHADSSYAIGQYEIVKDMLFKQAYSKDNLPAMLLSASNVPFPVDKSAISQSVRLSNGWVHMLDRATLPVVNKLIDTYVQGEEPWRFSASVTASTFHRIRKDPYGEFFKDIMIQNHGVSSLQVAYQTARMYSTTYDVYWRALNDVQANVFQQQLGIFEFDTRPSEDDPDIEVRESIYVFPYTNVEQNDYNEVYLGEFNLADYNRIVPVLQGAATTTNGDNTLVLDYLRFVPKLKTN